MKNEKLLLQGMVAAMFCWGLSWSSGKILSGYGSATNISFIRFAVTTISLVVLLVVIKEDLKFNKKGWWVLAGASICLSVYTFFFLKGLKVGYSGAGGVLTTTLNPIVTFILTLAITLQKPNKKETIGIVIGAIAGCILLKIWEHSDALFNGGNIFFLFATILWAILSRFTSMSKNYSSSLTFSLWLYALCSVNMFFVADYSETINILKTADTKFWVNMIFSSTITTSIATTFYFYATAQIGVNKASSFIFLVPLSAALGAWMFLGEIPQWHTIVGGILGVIAVYIITIKSK